MSSERTTRVTALSALVLASLALGVGLVNLGCERKSDLTAEEARANQVDPSQTNAEGARMPSTPLAEGPAPATVATVQKVTMEPPPSSKTVPASAATEPRGDTPVGSVSGGLTVKRLVMTNAIEDREPAQFSGFRTGEGQVVAFIEAQNAGDEAQKIIVTFEHASGTKVGFVNLQIPEKSSRWRTWARSSHITKVGEWTAVVRTGDGQELARQAFNVQG